LRSGGSSSAASRPSSPRTHRAQLPHRDGREFGRDAWLAGRLAPELFEFQRSGREPGLHDHPAAVAKTYDVKETAVADVVRFVDGAVPVLIPRVSPPLQ
jgi:hypothetical protein